MPNNIVRELDLNVFVDMERKHVDTDKGKWKEMIVLPDGMEIKSSVRYPLYEREQAKSNGITCRYCGKHASIAKLENSGKSKQCHINVYAEDGEMFSAMLNKPKKQGGGRTIDNLSIVCCSCMGTHQEMISKSFNLETK